jgi:hypothetical protein
MKDFMVNRVDESTGKAGLYMYIDFTEKLSGDRRFVDCYGSATVMLDGKNEYLFDYSFGHTPDWIRVTSLTLRPAERYKLDDLQLVRVGSDIINQIKSFITRLN